MVAGLSCLIALLSLSQYTYMHWSEVDLLFKSCHLRYDRGRYPADWLGHFQLTNNVTDHNNSHHLASKLETQRETD